MITPIQPHSEFIEMYNVPSDRNPKFTYVVALNSQSVWTCSCPAWVWAKPRVDCKHIARVIEWRGTQVNLPTVAPVKKSTRFSELEV